MDQQDRQGKPGLRKGYEDPLWLGIKENSSGRLKWVNAAHEDRAVKARGGDFRTDTRK